MKTAKLLATSMHVLGAVALSGCVHGNAQPSPPTQPDLGLRVKEAIAIDGLQFRDADGDGQLSPYEDWRLSPEERAIDLAGRMTQAEKVGTLMHSTMPGLGGELGRADSYDLEALGALVSDKHVTSYITRLTLAPAQLAEQNNLAQEVAAGGRLGIPLTISTDPRNHFSYVLGAAEAGSGTTQWPELLGFAALRDPALVREFGEIARREYRALGIHMALSPQLDLLTEPRWPRGSGTFGSQAELSSELGGAYVESFQGSANGLQADGVMTVVKHWVGYGAQPEGFEAHNYYGRFADPGDYLSQHIAAFDGALEAKSAGIMPAYPILRDATLNGEAIEAVSPGYSAQLLDGLLRQRRGYEGIILSDWAITRDCNERCMNPTDEAPQRPQDIATSWGVEGLTVQQRYVKGVQAGIDQFGGTDDVLPLLAAMEAGEIDEARVDQSVIRVMVPKFQLGLFENPYVSPAAATAAIGGAEDIAKADRLQRESQVLLRNEGTTLPFSPGAKVWLQGMSHDAAQSAGLQVVEDIADADFAIVRTDTPSEMLHPNHFFGSRYKEGRLNFEPGDPAYEALAQANAAGVPTMLAIFLDRPAVLTDVLPLTDVILANFGASDAAVLDVALGRAEARGRLPFELPRSMEAVRAQDPAAPDDSADPLYPYGAGL
ncbi:glycoside hydrolase family 3 protein [Aurantiacibacter odishensis]|uniref:glycoside hydrolase family 3 protein n=1 Tax=Aurantiacibacter odishensis TaxID=1155476 RepID=UPI001F0BB118|nr:glycoside hydrolase family 3 N-terminal domain-containing protein [Aurantiacibacter odishensis]